MKSKQYLEVLRTQLEKSLQLLNTELEADFRLEEREFLEDDKQVYGIQLLQVRQSGERRLWFRTYLGVSNDIKAVAFSELFDVIIGNFLIQASRTDDAVLEKLSNSKV